MIGPTRLLTTSAGNDELLLRLLISYPLAATFLIRMDYYVQTLLGSNK